MSTSTRNNPSWHPKWLIGCNLAALLLIGSWLLPVSRVWWDRLDAAVFYALNGSLASGTLWQGFWAIVNWRPFDLVAGLILLMLLWRWLGAESPRDAAVIADKLAAFIAFVLLVILTNLLFQQILHLLEYRRVSPSGALPGAIRLSHIVTWIKPKDYSGLSFPSDHGFVLIAAMVFFWRQGGRSLGLLAVWTLIPFVLPRLVGGGHWLTDTLVGATLMALVSLSLWFATPAHRFFARKLRSTAGKQLMFMAEILRRMGTG